MSGLVDLDAWPTRNFDAGRSQEFRQRVFSPLQFWYDFVGP